MTEYIPVCCFIAGVVAGAALTVIGFRLGFCASYEIRQSKDDPEEGKGLFGSKDPAEFDILEKET